MKRCTGHSAPPARLIRLLDRPGIRQIEDRLLCSYRAEPPLGGTVADDASLASFDIVYSKTLPPPCPWEWESLNLREQDDYLQQALRWEAQFEVADMDDFERVRVLKRMGWDFSDEYGKPLKVTAAFCRQAEAASKGLLGAKMPKDLRANTEQFEAGVTAARDAWMKARRR